MVLYPEDNIELQNLFPLEKDRCELMLSDSGQTFCCILLSVYLLVICISVLAI